MFENMMNRYYDEAAAETVWSAYDDLERSLDLFKAGKIGKDEIMEKVTGFTFKSEQSVAKFVYGEVSRATFEPLVCA